MSLFKSDASYYTESFTTDITVGHIESGTTISSGTNVKDVVRNIISTPSLPYDPTNPNTRYESKDIGTLSSIDDVDVFFGLHTPGNNWAQLKLGNYVTIQDGTYNTQWEIAGFDMEHNQLAADGTVYDNGYGICMIPKTTLGGMQWNIDDGLSTRAYMTSTMHTSNLPIVANKLKNVLGNHLIQRNVLLSSSIDTSIIHRTYHSNAYTWTTAYCTLMSIGQMNGMFASHYTKYDDGEANYKLPLFNYENYWTSSAFWSRCVWGNNNNKYAAWYVNNGGNLFNGNVSVSGTIHGRPLIYLR